MKSHSPASVHTELRDDLIAVIRKHGDKLAASEILAIAAHLVGQIIAMQDQRTMSREAVMQLVGANIENRAIKKRSRVLKMKAWGPHDLPPHDHPRSPPRRQEQDTAQEELVPRDVCAKCETHVA